MKLGRANTIAGENIYYRQYGILGKEVKNSFFCI